MSDLWGRSGVVGHPLGGDAWRAWWASPDADPALAWGVRGADGALLGALLARAPQRPWAPADLGHIALLVVDPRVRRRGLGGVLWSVASAALRERGRARVRLGAESERLFPGVPASAPPETWRFLRRRGVHPGGLEADLWLDLGGDTLERFVLPAGVILRADRRSEGEAFLAQVFPGRWADEVARAGALGADLLTLHRREELLGFVLARRPLPALAGASLTWTATAAWGPLDLEVAGIGPLGLAPAARGAGLGLAMVAAAGRHLRASGARAAVIDWTTLTPFYGRLGAFAWRLYQRADGVLAPT